MSSASRSAVEFLGYRADLPLVMDRAGLLIAPCPVEGLGLTLLEAMAGGLPVVAAGAAGHLDVLAGLDPRAMFPPGDVDAAARNLRSLAEDEPGRNALALAAHKRQQRGSPCAHRLPRPRPSTGVCDDRSRRDVARGLGRRLAAQPAPHRGPAANGCRAARALRRTPGRPDARPAIRGGAVVRAERARRFRMSRPAGFHGAPREVDAPPARPARRRAPRAGGDARRRLARHADPLLWINDPGAVALAERSGWPMLYDITDDWLTADRSANELTPSARLQRGAPARTRPRGGGVLTRTGSAVRARPGP